MCYGTGFWHLKALKTMNSDADALGLLTALRNQAFSFQSQKDQAQALEESMCHFYLIKQRKKTHVKHIWKYMRIL